MPTELQLAAPKPDALEQMLADGTYRETEMGTEKKCPSCGEYWPADSEFYRPRKYSRDGLEHICRACRSH